MKLIFSLSLILLILASTDAKSFTHHERGQICAEDRKDALDIDMNDVCLSWEAIYQTQNNQQEEAFIDGEFLMIIKPIAYGAKDIIQVNLKSGTYLSGIFNLHLENSVSTVSPGTTLANGVTDLFSSPCNYSNFINTNGLNSDCKSKTIVISGKNTNLYHPLLASQVISFKNTSTTPNTIISYETNSTYLHDMYYDSGFPSEHVHFHDAMVGQGKNGLNKDGTNVNLNNCKIEKDSELSQDCAEGLRDYFSNLSDNSSLPSGTVKDKVCTAAFSINKMLSFNNNIPLFNTNLKWAPSSGDLLSGTDIQDYFTEENSNHGITDKYTNLRAKRNRSSIATMNCEEENQNGAPSGGPYSGVAWGSNFAIAGFGSPLTLPEESFTNISEVTGTTAKGTWNFFGSLAALRSDGSVITWGYNGNGGDSSAVKSDLSSGVSKVYSNNYAFAAVKNDGSVITWGLSSSGGDSSGVSSQISSGVTKIFSTESAFAALKGDGSVIAWGFGDKNNHPSNFGGDASAVDISSDVINIFSTDGAFTALKSNGSVVTWGNPIYGGNAPQSVLGLTDIVDIFTSNFAFAALRANGEIISWGHDEHGGNSNGTNLTNISKAFGNKGGFAALKNDGSVVAWGNSARGGFIPASVSAYLSSEVTNIYSTDEAFAALKSDGSVVTWGNLDHGGDSSHVNLVNITEIVANHFSFAALDNSGKLITWGFGYQGGHHSNFGGDSSSVTTYLSSGVKQVISNLASFSAIKDDGSVITWGFGPGGGDSSSISSQLTSGVTKIYSSPMSFIALKN